MEKTRLTFGAVLLILVAAVALVIYALWWVGKNAHTIESGMGTVVGALVFVGVLAGAVVGAIWLARNRHHLVKREAPAGQPTIQMHAQQVPVAGAVPAPGLALGHVSALSAGQVPALAPGQLSSLPAGAPGPLVIYGLDHNQLGALLRDANLAAAAGADTRKEGDAP
jgi:hypothetical protein